MAQLLKISGSVYTVMGTCAPDALDDQLQSLLDNFNRTHPESYIKSAEHQIVVLSDGGALPKLLVSLLVNFSYGYGPNEELHPAVQHLAEKKDRPEMTDKPTEIDQSNPLS